MLTKGQLVILASVMISAIWFASAVAEVRDLPTSDENYMYMGRAYALYKPGGAFHPQAKGALYSLWLHVVSWFQHPPLELFYFNLKLLIVLSLVLLWGVLHALGASSLLTITIVFLQLILPNCFGHMALQIQLFALSIILLSLNVALRLRTEQGWYVSMGVGLLFASYARQEYVISLVLICLVLIYLMIRNLRRKSFVLKRNYPALLFFTLLLASYLFVNPLNPKRQWSAFRKNYVASAVAEKKVSQEILQNLTRQGVPAPMRDAAVKQLVGNTNSVFVAAWRNPEMLLSHLSRNAYIYLKMLARTPLVYQRKKITPHPYFSILQYFEWTLIIAALFACFYRRRFLLHRSSNALSRRLVITIALICLTALACALLVSSHENYFIVQNAMLLVIIAHFLSPRLGHVPGNSNRVNLLCLLCGVSLCLLVVWVAPAYGLAWNTVENNKPFLRRRQIVQSINHLGIKNPTTLLFVGKERFFALKIYLPANIRRILSTHTQYPLNIPFATWLERKNSNVIILVSMAKRYKDSVFLKDPEFVSFQTNHQKMGFEKYVFKRNKWVLYVQKRLLF